MEACAHAMDFEAATYRERLRFEAAGLVIVAIFTLARSMCQVVGLYVSNWVPTALTVASILLHLFTIRWRNKFWVSVVTIVSDCMLVAGSHTIVQVAFWEPLYSSLHLGDMPGTGRQEYFAVEYESLFHGLLFYISMSYSLQFAYLFRHAVWGFALGFTCYYTLLFAARLHVELDYPWTPASMRHPFLEPASLGVGLLLAVMAKSRSERYARDTFELMSLHKKQFFEEKSLRCQAEFKADFFRDARRGKRVSSEAGGSSYLGGAHQEVNRSLDVTAPRPRGTPPSHHSAPANLLPATLELFLRDAKVCQGQSIDGIEDRCSQMDCFAVNSMVWAEGHSAPKAVGQVAPGTRVLCWDSLQGAMKYAAVTGVEADSQASEWAEVSLVDGTRLTMTSDHPVQPVRENGSAFGERIVPAAQLSPMNDAVMVHKVVTVPVLVASVTCSSAADCDMYERVSVRVCQPERYNILVAAPGQDSEVRSLAVCSAGAAAQSLVKNTFVHIREDGGEEPPLRRATSEPPPRRCCPTAAPGRAPTSNEGSGARSSSSSSKSWASEGDASVNIVLPDFTPKVATGVDERRTGASLGELLRAKKAGLSSVGARNHAAGACIPCQLSFRGTCTWGTACQFCHEDQDHRQVKVRGKKTLLPR